MSGYLKVRALPIVVKLDPSEFRGIITQSLSALHEIFQRNNYELRIAGGAVRDLLMKKTPSDIDFATVATPTQMKEMFTQENIRMINLNGEKHGTITARIQEEQFEVTTLRIDVKTDGRHAEVQYTTDWQLDSNRRDLTINSMFLDLNGNVYDYFYGHDDLMAKRVKFVGNPDKRIKEDYLRILRYFRFYGRIADTVGNHDDETIEAIKINANGMKNISGERIWSEFQKIITGNHAPHLIEIMNECGLFKFMGFDQDCMIEEFANLYNNQHSDPGHKLKPISFIAALLSNMDDALKFHQRIKLSAYDRDLLIYLKFNKYNKPKNDENNLLYYQKEVFNTNRTIAVRKEQVLELLKYYNEWEIYEQLLLWIPPKFPVSGETLITKFNCQAGLHTGKIMTKLKESWMNSSFKMDTDDLLALVPDLLLNDENCRPPVMKRAKKQKQQT